MAFAVWNGSSDEVNGQKSITLDFAQLDTRSGELSTPGPATGGGGGGDAGTTESGPPLSTPALAVIGVLVIAVTGWIGVYWESRRRS